MFPTYSFFEGLTKGVREFDAPQNVAIGVRPPLNEFEEHLRLQRHDVIRMAIHRQPKLVAVMRQINTVTKVLVHQNTIATSIFFGA